MLQNAADEISTAFDLVIDSVARAQAAVRQAGAKAFLDENLGAASNLAATHEALSPSIKKLEAIRSHLLEALRNESNTPAAESAAPVDSGYSTEALQLAGAPLLTMTYNGVSARAVESGRGLLVLAGSTVMRKTYPSLPPSLLTRREQSERDGALIPTASVKHLKLTEDLSFDSPSAAAQFVAGCSVSGTREWKRDTAAFLHSRRPDTHGGLMN